MRVSFETNIYIWLRLKVFAYSVGWENAFTRGSHCYIPCTSICDGDFTDILIPYATRVRKGGVTTRARSYTCPFTTRNQRIKTLEKLGQAIKQAPRYESSDQGLIFEIKIFDRRRSWKYRAYSGDYPLF